MRSLVWIALFLSGCSMLHKPSAPTFNERQLNDQKAKLKDGHSLIQNASAEWSGDPVQASLWSNSGNGTPSIIRNQKAQKVGDLLTIMVDESATASTQADTTANKDNQYAITAALSGGQGTSAGWGTLSGTTENKSQFTGTGITDRTGKLTTTVQASVENVLPNGTLFVRGKKAITINNEDQEIEVSGFVRPDDILINNLVASSKLADAEIRYAGRGVVSDKQNTGWGTRLLDALWPF